MSDTRTVVHEILRRHGLRSVFGNPGSNELPFLKDFPADFRYYLGLHEGVAMGMADGYAQASGRPAIVNLHAAAGTGNAMGALTNAAASHTPLILIAGQQVRSMIGVEPLLTNVRATELPRPLVKWSCEPLAASDVPRAVEEAIHMALAPPRGPVFVSIPYDDWDRDLEAAGTPSTVRNVEWGGALTSAQADRLVAAFDQAANPLLVLGAEVDTGSGYAAAVTLAERLGAPVWVAPSASRCPFPTTHPAFRGVLPASIAGIRERLEGHDLVVTLGAPVFRYHESSSGRYLPAGTRLIHVTSDPREAARAPVGEAFIADVALTLALLAGRVRVTGRAASPRRKVPDDAAGVPGQLSPARLFATLDRLAPPGVAYVDESTATKSAFWAHMRLTQPGSYYFPAAGGLGFGLPAALGIQLASPGRRVVAVIGDGAANFSITALWSAARYRIPVIIVVLKNETYGALRWFAGVLGTGDTPGLDIPGIDFCALARGYGVPAEGAADARTLEDLFARALGDRSGPHLIEVRTTLTEP